MTMDRQIIRETAGRVARSEDLTGTEKEDAAEFLRENPALGNPHLVRCDWCHATRMLFRDEDMGAFTRAGRGWRCNTCGESSRSQEVRF